MEFETKMDMIDKILLDAYHNDNLSSFIVIASAYNDSHVSYSMHGRKYSIMALLNRIIAELSEQWGMSTSDILDILVLGQKEYDEWIERKKK